MRTNFNLMAPIIFVVLATIGLSAWLDYVNTANILREALHKHQVLTCREVATEIELRIKKTLEFTKLLTLVPETSKVLTVPTQDPMYPTVKQTAHELMTNLISHHQDNAEIAILKLDGSPVIYTFLDDYLQDNYNHHLFFADAMQGKIRMGSFLRPKENKFLAFVSSPIIKQDKIIGVIFVNINIQNLSKTWMSRLSAKENILLTIYNNKNESIFSSNPDEHVNSQTIVKNHAPLFNASPETMVEFYNNELKLGTYIFLKDLNWKVMVSSAKDPVFADAQSRLVQIIITNSALGLLVSFVLIWLIQKLKTNLTKQGLELSRVNTQLSNLTNNIPGGVCTISLDPSGYKIIYASAGYYNIHGYTKAQMENELDNNALNLIHPQDRSLITQQIKSLSSLTPKLNTELRIIKRDGSIAWEQVQGNLHKLSQKDDAFSFVTIDITEAKKLEEEIQKNEAQLHLIIESAHVATWVIDLRTHTVELNFATRNMFAWEKLQYTLDDFIAYCHPEDMPNLAKTINDPDTLNLDFECRFLHHDGHWHWVILRGCKMQTLEEFEFLGIVIDTHMRKEHALLLEDIITKRTQELTKERNFLKSLMDAIPDIIFYKDERFRYLGSNKSFLDFLGFTSLSSIYQKSDAELFDNPMIGETCVSHDRLALASNVPILNEEIVCNSKGEPITLETSKVHFKNADGSPGGIVCVARDITSRKQMESALKLSQQEAQAANQAKSQFLANMSHEIRTPLNGIIGMNYLAIQAEPSSRIKEYLLKLETSAQSLLNIVNDILDFSKIEAKKMELEYKPFSLTETIESIRNMMQPLADKANLTLKIYQDPTLPQMIMGDSLRYSQIVLNLLSNAIKFTPKGTVTAEFYLNSLNPIQVIILTKVTDTGIGLTETQINKLFSAFTQADSSISRKFGGTGLGLAISKALVEMMGGEINLKSIPNQGTTFCFTAYFCLPDSQTSNSTSTIVHPYSARASLNNLPILLVEDNEINQIIATEVMEQFGCLVDIANDGQEAIKKAKNKDYAIIFMDIQMPVMDGFEATRILRQDPDFKQIPIIAMTAHALSNDYDKSIAIGMNDHITKPIDPNVLLETIYKWQKID